MTQSKAREEIERPPRPPKPKPLPVNRVLPYENMRGDTETSVGVWEASPCHFDEGSDDNVDDDDEGLYVSSDEDYIYPEIDVLEWSTSSCDMPESSKQQLDHCEKPKKTPLKDRLFAKFKAAPKSPPFFSSNVSGSPQGSTVPVSPPTPSREAAGRDFPQSLPDDLGNLSVSEVSECLRLLNMGEHVETFESEQIDGELFMTLNKDTLPYLGVSNKFQQQKLLKFIQGWRPARNNQL